MISPKNEKRGQPLLFLGLLGVSWILLRSATWEYPWPRMPDIVQIASSSKPSPQDWNTRGDRTTDRSIGKETHRSARSDQFFAASSASNSSRTSPIVETGNSYSFMTGTGDLPIPTGGSNYSVERSGAPVPNRIVAAEIEAKNGTKRWRFDGWLFLRDGSPTLVQGGVRPATYGASQVGGVLSYRLSPLVDAYTRASHALVEMGETELALGMRVQPVAGLPLRVHAEGRLTRNDGRTEVRPAAFVTGGFDIRALPAGMKVSSYAQAGYVGGDFATAFADGAVQVERDVAKLAGETIEIGAGVWGGVQKDASRLDIGPTIRLDLELADTPVRLSTDYRVRVAGNAEPSSGIAVTLSTGF